MKKNQTENNRSNNKPGATKEATVTGSHKSGSKQLAEIKNSNSNWQLAKWQQAAGVHKKQQHQPVLTD